MADSAPILVTGAAGQVGAVGRIVTGLLLDRRLPVRAMVHREDERAAALRAAGAEVVVGDLLEPADVLRVVSGCRRVYLGMSVSPGYLEATVTMAAVAREVGVDALVNISQMTVSQMSIQNSTPSRQQRQHWLSEQALAWSGLPVVTIRPTIFLESFFPLIGSGVRDRSRIELPFGRGKTSPVAAADVARVVAAVLADPGPHLGRIYELTGPRSQDMHGVAREFSEALNRAITYLDIPPDAWERELKKAGLPEHLTKHLVTMGELHRVGRYDRLADGVARVTGQPSMSVREFVSLHTEEFGGRRWGGPPRRDSLSKGGTMNAADTATGIRPFQIRIREEQIDDLRRRIAATRWPTKELVEDRSQGVQLTTLRNLAHYWATEYDWRKCEARLNALPQFRTRIDGVEIHFIHVRSRHENALPLIMTHGWPGSVVELLETVGPLTDPTSHGGAAGDAFHLVLPSLPGYGFSGEPAELGWDSGRIARAWATLMKRLGYTRYVAQGGDVGADVTDAMGRQGAEGLVGIHLTLLSGALGIVDHLPAKSEQELAARNSVGTFKASGFGYFLEQSTRPQTIGYSLLDSPIGLAAWLLDHDTDSYYKISRAFVEGKPVGRLTRESIVDNITLYWLTGTGASAARWYWEFAQFLAAAIASGAPPPPVKVPVGFTTFPGELWAAPRSWAEAVYPGLAYFNEVDRGGHFAAWEEPALFASELRAAFKPLL